MAVVRDNNKWNADLLTDLTSLGSDDGVTSDVVAWAVDQNNWYYPNVINAGTSTWTAQATGGTAIAGLEGFFYNGNQFYVDANDRNSYPGTGTTWTDLIAAVAGTMTSVTIVDGHFNFDGAASNVDFPKTSISDDIFAGGGTISVWIRVETDGENNLGTVADTSASTGTAGWALRTDGEAGLFVDVTFAVGFSTSGGSWNINLALDRGQWHHVVVTYDSDATVNDPIFYINTVNTAFGTELTPVGTYGSDAGNALVVGNRSDGTRTFDGDIDQLLLWDRTLSADEVEQLFRVMQDRYRPTLLGDAPTTTTGPSAPISILTGDGGSVSGQSGDLSLQTGTATGLSSVTGDITLLTGTPGGANATSGAISATTGSGGSVLGGSGGISWLTGPSTGSVDTGTILLQTGIAAGDASVTGAITLLTGAPTGTTADSGAVSITTGNGGSLLGLSGDIDLQTGTSSGVADTGTIRATLGTPAGSGARGLFEVTHAGPDTSGTIQLNVTGSNGAAVVMFAGTRAPDTLVSATPGSVYLRNSTTLSSVYVNTGTGTSTTWTDLAAGGGGGGSAWSEETAQTTDATVGVTIATPISPVTDGTQHSVEVLITAESTGANTYFRRQVFTFYRDGGGAVQWTTEINGVEAIRGFSGGPTASLSVSGNDVLVTATGFAATTIDWLVQYRTTNTITNGGTVSTTGIVRETFDNRGAATTTGSASASGGTVDFTIAAGAAYVTMQYLRVKVATGTCADATIQFFRDVARTDEIYDAQNKDTSTANGWVDRNPSTMMGDDGTGLASNIMYGRITNNDAGAATFNVEAVLWGVV